VRHNRHSQVILRHHHPAASVNNIVSDCRQQNLRPPRQAAPSRPCVLALALRRGPRTSKCHLLFSQRCTHRPGGWTRTTNLALLAQTPLRRGVHEQAVNTSARVFLHALEHACARACLRACRSMQADRCACACVVRGRRAGAKESVRRAASGARQHARAGRDEKTKARATLRACSRWSLVLLALRTIRCLLSTTRCLLPGEDPGATQPPPFASP